MLIYKIFRQNEWQDLVINKQTYGAPIDIADGFIHLSTAIQVRQTAQRHFANENHLILAAVCADAVGKGLRWDIARGGQQFPHIYDTLKMDQIKWHCPLPLVDGVHVFPKLADEP